MQTSVKTYNSINTLPIFNWWQIHETGNLKWLLIDGVLPDKELEVLWEKIYNEYFEVFGINETFKDILQKRCEIAQMQCERWLENDKSIETFIKLKQNELDALMQANSVSFLETKTFIEKNMQFQINIHTTSVAEFYTYLKTVNNGK